MQGINAANNCKGSNVIKREKSYHFISRKVQILFIILPLSRLHYRFSELCQTMVNTQVKISTLHTRGLMCSRASSTQWLSWKFNQLSRFLLRNLCTITVFFCISASEKYKKCDRSHGAQCSIFKIHQTMHLKELYNIKVLYIFLPRPKPWFYWHEKMDYKRQSQVYLFIKSLLLAQSFHLPPIFSFNSYKTP